MILKRGAFALLALAAGLLVASLALAAKGSSASVSRGWLEPRNGYPTHAYQLLSLPYFLPVGGIPWNDTFSLSPVAQDGSGGLIVDDGYPEQTLSVMRWPERRRVGPIRYGQGPVCLSLDGRLIAYQGRRPNQILMEDVTTGKFLGTFGAHYPGNVGLTELQWIDGGHLWAVFHKSWQIMGTNGLHLRTFGLVIATGSPAKVVARVDDIADWGGWAIGIEHNVAVLHTSEVTDARHEPCRQSVTLIQMVGNTVTMAPVWSEVALEGHGDIAGIALAGNLLLLAEDCTGLTRKEQEAFETGQDPPPGLTPITRIRAVGLHSGRQLWASSFRKRIDFCHIDPGNGVSLWTVYSAGFSHHWADLWCVDVSRGTDVIGRFEDFIGFVRAWI